MQAAFLVHITGKLLSLMLGSVAVFCLYYAGQLPDYDTVWYCLIESLEFGGGATAIVYSQRKYLDQ
jgi:hypothetical protein